MSLFKYLEYFYVSFLYCKASLEYIQSCALIRHRRRHERGMPEVRVCCLTVNPERKPRQRPGKAQPLFKPFQRRLGGGLMGIVRIVNSWLFFVPQVFVEYANAGDSKEAQRLLTGRTFDGKFVVATFYPLSAYKRGYLYQTVQ